MRRSQQEPQFLLQGLAVGGKGAVAAGGSGQIGAGRVQRQWQPPQSRRQFPGLLGGAGRRSSVQQDLPRRLHRQRLQWQQLCARTPGLLAAIPAGHHQQAPAVRTDPAAIVGHRLPCRADLVRLVGVVHHQQPTPHLPQLSPDHIRQARLPRSRGLQLCLWQAAGQRRLHHLLRQLGTVAPAHPEHSPARRLGLGGQLRGHRCLAHPADRAQHREPALWPPKHACQYGEFSLTPPHALNMRVA